MFFVFLTSDRKINQNYMLFQSNLFYFYLFMFITYWFQVYSLVVRHLHNLQSAPPNIPVPTRPLHSSHSITDRLPWAALSLPGLLCNCPSVLPAPPLLPQPHPRLQHLPVCSVSNSFLFCLLVYFVHQIPHMSEIIWYLAFSD